MPSSVERWNTWPTESPAPFRPSSSASVSMALLPSMLISVILGRSTTITTSTLPSRPRRISSKLPVANRLRAASRTTRALIKSPTPTGSAANTLPAEMRCSPSTRISEMMKVSAWVWFWTWTWAWAWSTGTSSSARASHLGIRDINIQSTARLGQDISINGLLSKPPCCVEGHYLPASRDSATGGPLQASDIVIDREQHDPQDHHQPQLIPQRLYFLRYGASSQ